MSTDLRDAMDELVDGCEGDHGDWSDVVVRAKQIRSPSRRRYAVLALVLLACTLALLATPAFGLREAVLGLIGREDVEFEEGRPAPEVVRRQFEDLALGAPPGMDPQAIPDAMRRAGTFKLGGRDRALWVGPTRRGGFCYGLEGSGGGCLRNEPFPAGRVAVSYQATSEPGEPVEAGPVQGWILDPDAFRISIEFEDETRVDVPFIYVSAPIDAGFFVYDLPVAKRLEPHRPRAVAVYDAAGDEIAREPIRYGRLGHAPMKPSPPRRLAQQPPVPPSAPLQQATVKGVRVIAGANGAVAFDATQAHAALLALLQGRPATYVCFQFRDGAARGYGVSGAFAQEVGLRFFGLGTPFDGCEIQGSYGHRWPDRLASHGAVEMPFTVKAARYFTDRAAARDLALFVRSRKVQALRKQTGSALAGALQTVFGDAIDQLSSRDERPEVGRIGYWVGPDRTVFREISPTGRSFEVEVVKGKIARQNLGELAMVF